MHGRTRRREVPRRRRRSLRQTLSTLDARFVSGVGGIGRATWEPLRPDDHPFTAYDCLEALESSGSLSDRLGWRPHHLLLTEQGQARAVAPCYLKSNSHGEFVFDHAWAEAFHRYGRSYYPKLLCAIPYTPVSARRVLGGRTEPARWDLAACAALEAECERLGLSGAHINFMPEGQSVPDHWIIRHDVQFHWRHQGWRDFDDFLASLSSKKRKNIRQERRHIADSAICIRRCWGEDLSEADMRAMYGFYLETFSQKGNYPALTESLFLALRERMAEQVLVVLAERDGRPIAGAMFLFDERRLYGRYWGCDEEIPGLHFELCYYQGIEFCLQRGLQVFEPGAQGEHKLARGFMPTLTRSAHYIADPAFRDAIAEATLRECAWVDGYRKELASHSPYRMPPCAT